MIDRRFTPIKLRPAWISSNEIWCSFETAWPSLNLQVASCVREILFLLNGTRKLKHASRSVRRVSLPMWCYRYPYFKFLRASSHRIANKEKQRRVGRVCHSLRIHSLGIQLGQPVMYTQFLRCRTLRYTSTISSPQRADARLNLLICNPPANLIRVAI